MTVFISYSVNAKHGPLGAPYSKSKSTLCQSIVFLCLCLRVVLHLCFSFCKVFTSEASNDLAESMEVDVFKGDWVEAFPNGFPPLATSHERAAVPVSTGSQRSRSGQQLRSQSVRSYVRARGQSAFLPFQG